MKSFEYDLRYVDSGLEILEGYLLSGEVFWPIHAIPPEGEPQYPQLTLDGMLLAYARLMSQGMTPEQELHVAQISTSLEYHRVKWRVAWQEKAGQCFLLRERMWSHFLQEYRDDPQENADRYGYEVRLRVMLELIQSESGMRDEIGAGILTSLDEYLKRSLLPSDFIWDVAVQPGFPQNIYWYLYGVLPPIPNK